MRLDVRDNLDEKREEENGVTNILVCNTQQSTRLLEQQYDARMVEGWTTSGPGK